jgi:hypothetical protein
MNSFQEMIKSADYLQAVHGLAKAYKITFEEMLERERKGFAEIDIRRAEETAIASAKQKIRDECVYFCYQDLGHDVYKHTNGQMLHGWYRIVKTDTCYEFTLVETDMQHLSWQKRIKEKHVTRFPLDMMGKGSFKDITPDKIHTF